MSVNLSCPAIAVESVLWHTGLVEDLLFLFSTTNFPKGRAGMDPELHDWAKKSLDELFQKLVDEMEARFVATNQHLGLNRAQLEKFFERSFEKYMKQLEPLDKKIEGISHIVLLGLFVIGRTSESIPRELRKAMEESEDAINQINRAREILVKIDDLHTAIGDGTFLVDLNKTLEKEKLRIKRKVEELSKRVLPKRKGPRRRDEFKQALWTLQYQLELAMPERSFEIESLAPVDLDTVEPSLFEKGSDASKRARATARRLLANGCILAGLAFEKSNETSIRKQLAQFDSHVDDWADQLQREQGMDVERAKRMAAITAFKAIPVC